MVSAPHEVVSGLVDEVIAFYLPQFHPIPENDEFWGQGFTEWTNVASAKPLFAGHRQPRIPADLGFYDLRLGATRSAQAALATAYGVTAFCYWHYWFAGRVVLEGPLREVIESGEPSLPFCVGWANQSWTGIWHGAPGKILIEQTYPGADDHRRHFESLLPAFSDPRHLRVGGRLVFLVLEPREIPDLPATVELWRHLAQQAGLGDLYLVAPYDGGSWRPRSHGFDGSIAIHLPDEGVTERRRGPTVISYADAITSVTSLAADEHFPCVIPQWDNTPRSGRKGLVLQGSTPELFGEQVSLAARKLASMMPGERLLWVKSWNEWAEGNMLEPDRDHGHGYLEALRSGLAEPASEVPAKAAGAWGVKRSRGAARVRDLALRHAAGEGPLHRRGADEGAEPIPVVICVDCEPDPRIIDPSAPPDLDGFRLTHEFFRRWRDRAADVTGAPVPINWFVRMDEQVTRCYGSAAAFPERHPAIFEEIVRSGDGLGIHPHAFRWDDERQTWFGDFAISWLVDNLGTALETFHRSFGHAPELLRYGDSILADEIVALAESAGVRFDLTLEPGRPEQPLPEVGEWANALQPDWERVPRKPYAPSRDDYRRAGEWGSRDITLIPLTSSFLWPGRSVRTRLGAIRRYGLEGRRQRHLLYMAMPYWQGHDTFQQAVKRSVVAQRRPYLAFALRSDRARQVDQWQRIERCLDDLLALHPQRPLVFCTPAQACERLGLTIRSQTSS